MASVAHRKVTRAVHRHRHLSRQGLLERAFTFAFRGLVYAQIWEDPAVDMEALAITPDCHVVTIASGGCNVLRSEEHTSELQSLMRISYAVFCLKKKKVKLIQTNTCV